MPRRLGLGLGQPDGGDLRVAIGAAGDGGGGRRMGVPPRDQLGHHHAFMAGLVREPRRAGDVADGP